MKHYVLEPEVAGGFGENTIFIDRTARPPELAKFEYEFDVWLGDPLLEAVGCYIVLQSVQQQILALRATGVTFGDADVSRSTEFEDLYPGRNLPRFVWLRAIGKAGKDDFGMSLDSRLVVSERILDLLQRAGMSHCDIGQFNRS